DIGVIRTTTRDALVRIGKALFYPDRAYESLLARAAEEGLPPSELHALRDWLPAGRIDQKREDALATLAAMREFLDTDPPPARVDYVFEPSEMWDRAALTSLPPELAPADEAPKLSIDAVLDEVRLDGLAYAKARRAGLLRFLALEAGDRRRAPLSDEARRDAATLLRRRLGLFGREATGRWLTASVHVRQGLARPADDEGRLARLDADTGMLARAHVLDQLRLAGDYEQYAARARAKQRVLAESAVDHSHVDEWTRFRLTVWYFEKRLGSTIPDDISAYATGIGFADLDAFYRALAGEHRYVTLAERSVPLPTQDPPADRQT